MSADCPLCHPDNENVLWQSPELRIIRVEDPDYPAFLRVIWQEHVAEMSDLSPTARQLLMDAVYAAEGAVRDIAQPDKINLASLGNMVPHLHWHVIGRYRHDKHFPNPVWGEPQRPSSHLPTFADDAFRLALERRLG